MGPSKTWRSGQIALVLLVATVGLIWLLRKDRPAQVGVPAKDIFNALPPSALAIGTNVFDAFAAWSRHYIDAPSEERKAEGVMLARTRRTALKGLIRANPQQALELAIPLSVRRQLPGEVVSLIEERVSGRGELSVMAALAEPGKEREVTPLFRVAKFGEKRYEAFVYGRRLGHPTRPATAMHGIAVDDLLAVHEEGVRTLDPGEADDIAGTEGICGISGEPASVANGGTLVEVAGERQVLCQPGHVDDLNQRLVQAEGAPSALGLGTGDSPEASLYTQGEKRILIVRVDFSDLPGEPFSQSAGSTLLSDLAVYFRDASYGKMVVPPPGQGSDVTPTFRMPNSAAYYGTNNYYERLRTDARRLAEEAGYFKNRFEFDVICFGNVPGWFWAGLAYVGGPGAWLRNSFGTGVAAHELGHNLGLNHANYWDTGAESVIGPGTSIEYGDTFDTMGGGGTRAYNARYRAYLNWLGPEAITTVSGAGVYQLNAYDVPNSTGINALKVERHTGTFETNSFWLEFSLKTNATEWQKRGAGLRWAGDGSRRTLLLDTTPGSSGGKDDSPIGIGRTFADPASHVYITVLGKLATVPGSLHILVNRGPFPDNVPPMVSIDSSLTSVAVGGNVTFRATASDPNNDALAFAWDFGDGTVSTENSETVNRTWSKAGEFLVHCVASDMKGGQASDWRVIRVGSPASYRIRGRVTTQDGVPMEGVRVRVSDGQVVYSRSDGAYSVVGLPAGSYNVGASSEGWGFSSPGFRNPVTVGPNNAENINFFGGPPGLLRTKVLVGFSSTWSYLDNGSNPGTDWTGLNFDDSSWKAGVAELGYGDGDEATIVRSGTNPTNHFITTHFRQTFYVTNQTRLTSANLRLRRDDGGVVYLNGREVFRSFMPSGPINHNTLALFHTEGWAERTSYEADVEPDALVTGRNIIAVEIHQASPSSPDISFDLSLTATELIDVTRGIAVVSPTNNAVFPGFANILVRADASAGPSGTMRRVEFLQGNSTIGDSTNSPFSVIWSNVLPGAYAIRAVGTDNAGLTFTSSPVNITVQAVPAYVRISNLPQNAIFLAPTNITISADASPGPSGTLTKVEFFNRSNKLGDDIDVPYGIVWSNAPPGNHALTAVATHQSLARTTSAPPVNITVEALRSVMLLARRSVWRYHDPNTEPSPTWRGLSYNDSMWAAGAAPLGAGDPHVTTLIHIGPSGARHPTLCFRRAFNLTTTSDYEAIVLRVLRDDGAAVYLNDSLVIADGVSVPTVFSQYATQVVEGAMESAYVEYVLPTTALRVGTNIVAVEIKNANATSDDLGFDLEIEALLESGPPTLRSIDPPPDASVAALRYVNVEFDAPVTGVDAADLFMNGQTATSVVAVNSHAFTFTFSQPPSGFVQMAWAAAHGITDSQANSFIGGPWTYRFETGRSGYDIVALATWNYLDSGADPGSTWNARAFDDLLWRSGPSQLGYGDGDEITRISNNGERHPTCYFRRNVVLFDPAFYDAIQLSWLVDDGAVIYVNGLEAARTRMPPGPPTFATLASASGDFSWESVSLLPSLFLPGRNVIGVEVHQNTPMDSDASFDVILRGIVDQVPPRVTAIEPSSGSMLEELNSITVDFNEEMAGVDASDLLVNDGAATNVVHINPRQYTFQFQQPGTGIVRVAWAPNHGITDMAHNRNSLGTGNWSYVLVPLNDRITLVAKGAIWKYVDTGVDLGTAWRAPEFDDSLWPSGRAELGYGDGDEATVVSFGQNPIARYATTYFRRKFVVDEPAAYGNLVLEVTYDDGAIIYINGSELARVRIPGDSVVNYDTYIGSGADYQPAVLSVPRDMLLPGTNTIAVEVHQADSSSGDLSFDLKLEGNLPPSVAITSPRDDEQLAGPTNIILAIAAADPDGSIAAVEFFDHGVLIGESTVPPFSLTWSNVADGAYLVTARARDNLGATRVSSPVSIFVNDPSPPVIAFMYVTTNEVRVTFSKRLSEATAASAANYTISNGVTISSVALGADLKTVTLRTSPLDPQRTYVLFVQGVIDLIGQPIAAGTRRSFNPEPFQSANLGAGVNGSVSFLADGYEIGAGGALGIGGIGDNFFYYWEERSGDFDVQVRLESLSLADVFTKAGLMVRERLTESARFAAVFATPGISGCFFQYRTNAAYRTIENGSFPVNYPNTWVRLKREGLTNFTGFASADGKSWMVLSTARINLPDRLYFGFAVSSRSATERTTAQFRDFGVTASTTMAALDREPLGPSTRRGPLVISEIMYRPSVGWTSSGYPDQYEFIELFNSSPIAEDIGNWRISGSANFTFPAGTFIPAGGFMVVAANPTLLRTFYGLGSMMVFGPYTGAFGNPLPEEEGGTVQLRNEFGAIICDVTHGTATPWPVAANGAGHSLVLTRPSLGERDPRAWAASDQIGGSPGRMDPFPSDAARDVVINESLAPAYPSVDGFIELYNHSNTEIDLSGCWLADNPNSIRRSANKFRIPNGTRVAPCGFVTFDAAEVWSSPGFDKRWVYFVNAVETRVLDAVDFQGQPDGTSGGRFPDGAPTIDSLSDVTRGTANSVPAIPDVVINEIMYHPPSGNNADEFIELHNRSVHHINVSGWRFTQGVEFEMPLNTVIPGGGFLVVARNVARARANHPSLNALNSVGNYDGSLNNTGERLVLSMPKPVRDTNGIPRSRAFITVDEVTYGTGGRWGQWSDGGGSSLELTDPQSDNRLAPNWADSDETQKSSWTTAEFNGLTAHGSMAPADNLLLFLQGPGECLLDDVQVFLNSNPGNNLVRNADFEEGTTNWYLGGTHEDSSWEATEGHHSPASLRVRATRHGDASANRVRTPLRATIVSSNSITIRAKARWLKGDRFLLLRLRGNSAEAPCDLPLPANLGTPGAPNSRYIGNAGPALYDVNHSPVLPSDGEAVVVTCRASDPDGVSQLNLIYRLDPEGSAVTVLMRDDGLPNVSGDTVAGDGLFSALVPGQAAGALVAFYIEARDGSMAQTRFPADAPNRECLIRFGDTQPSGNLGAYRIWFTGATRTRWETREKNSSKELDCTFVYNNYRVIYNAGTLYAGSVWHTPGYSSPIGTMVCDYELHAPPDDRLLNADDMVFAAVGNNNNDPTAVAEQSSYWIARKLGIPWTYRRFVHMFVMGNRRGIVFEDAQQPKQDFLDAYFPDDSQGPLHRIQDWFEFTEDGDRQLGNVDAKLTLVTTTNAVKWTPIYREWWRPRANGLKSPNDFSDLYTLVDAVNLPKAEPYTSRTESLADMEEWMAYFAFQHIVGNWDSYGYRRGNNAYAYKPENGKWLLIPYDVDFDLGMGGDGPTQSLFDTGGIEPKVAEMFAHPPFLRAYWRAYRAATAPGGPLNSSVFDPIIDSLSAALVLNGLGVVAPTTEKNYVASRRNYIISQIPQALFAVNGPTSVTNSANLATITGTAPIDAKDVFVNGLPATWTNVTTWSAPVVLHPGQNSVVVEARDGRGNLIPNGSRTLLFTYTGSEPDPRPHLVISEIMYNPDRPGGAFVEIQNRSSVFGFDLSGWKIHGIGYTFPTGFVVYPTQIVAIVEDASRFLSYYGTNGALLDAYTGHLDAEGEVISLIKPGSSPDADLTVDRIRYESRQPWPLAASGGGSSIQVIDVDEDNTRVSNWSDGRDWKFFSFTGVPTTTTLMFYLTPTGGEIYLDDIYVCAGGVAESGPNLVRNPGFEEPFAGSWLTNINTRHTFRQSTVVRSGNSALRLHFLVGGGSMVTSFTQTNVPVTTGSVYTLSFWYSYGTNAPTLRASLSGTSMSFNAPLSARPIFSSAGLPNAGARNLPPYDPVWLNEAQVNNATGVTDNMSEREPWIELYNGGATAINLDSYYLSDDYSNLAKWVFPAGTTLNPGHRIIWMDGEGSESVGGHLHAGFRLTASSASVVLSRALLGSPLQIVDYLNFPDLSADASYGDVPDGDACNRQVFYSPTPGTTNRSSPLSVYINEWMAANQSAVADPSDLLFDDWFELYNGHSFGVDISGYYLSDRASTAADRKKFRIPIGTVIPARGYLVVWADEDEQHNGFNSDLHGSFQLNRSSDRIFLHAPDGHTVVDAIVFGPQTTDVTQGRYPDGSAVSVLSRPTPGAANVGNAPPFITPIANKTVLFGQTLSFHILASDTEAPPQILDFSLLVGPSGSTIDTRSGLFAWTPRWDETPSTNTVTVRVTDNGIPSLADTRTFTVIAYPSPHAVVSRSGPSVSITFNTVDGTSYQLEYADSLVEPTTWQPVGLPVSSTGNSMTVNDNISGPQRFYRIRQQ